MTTNTGATNATNTSGAGAQSAAAYAPKVPRFTDFEVTLRALGYHFTMSELDGGIFVNGQPITNELAAEIRVRMRDLGYIQRDALEDAITVKASANRFHPIKNYLQGLTWDGTDYLHAVAACLVDAHPPIKYQSGHSEPVSYAFFKRWGIGAIAKLFEDGTLTAQNPMLVFDSKQDLGKSTFVCLYSIANRI